MEGTHLLRVPQRSRSAARLPAPELHAMRARSGSTTRTTRTSRRRRTSRSTAAPRSRATASTTSQTRWPGIPGSRPVGREAVHDRQRRPVRSGGSGARAHRSGFSDERLRLQCARPRAVELADCHVRRAHADVRHVRWPPVPIVVQDDFCRRLSGRFGIADACNLLGELDAENDVQDQHPCARRRHPAGELRALDGEPVRRCAARRVLRRLGRAHLPDRRRDVARQRRRHAVRAGRSRVLARRARRAGDGRAARRSARGSAARDPVRALGRRPWPRRPTATTTRRRPPPCDPPSWSRAGPRPALSTSL